MERGGGEGQVVGRVERAGGDNKIKRVCFEREGFEVRALAAGSLRLAA